MRTASRPVHRATAADLPEQGSHGAQRISASRIYPWSIGPAAAA